jgi:hypothetical protein
MRTPPGRLGDWQRVGSGGNDGSIRRRAGRLLEADAAWSELQDLPTDVRAVTTYRRPARLDAGGRNVTGCRGRERLIDGSGQSRGRRVALRRRDAYHETNGRSRQG